MSDQVRNESVEINRTRLMKIGIASGVVLVLLGLLFVFAFLGRSSWTAGMARQIQNVLDENGLEYTVGEMDSIHGGLASNLVSFTLGDSGDHGIMVRASTLYGPLPAVFICGAESSRASFVGFADLDGIAEDVILDAAKGSQIPYWEERIPKILGTAKKIHASSKEESK